MLWPGNKTIQLAKECCSALLAQARPTMFYIYTTIILSSFLCFRSGGGICWDAKTRTAYHLHQFLCRHGRGGGRGGGSGGLWSNVWVFCPCIFECCNYTSDLMVHTCVSCFTVGGRRQWPPPISTCSPYTQVQGGKREERWPSQFMERLPPEGTPSKMEAEYHSSCEGEYFTWTRLLR